jgi:hypothetical protein
VRGRYTRTHTHSHNYMLTFENISAWQLILAKMELIDAAFDGGRKRLGEEKEKGNQDAFSAMFSAHNGNWSPISIVSGKSDLVHR